MLVPQDIKNKTFEKAVFGGYDMASVDDFLEEIYASLSEANKESQTLKAKLKVLASKIEEYRESESGMSRALIAAEKTSSHMEQEAKLRSERIIAEAELAASKILSDAKIQIKHEEEKLIEAKRASAQFLENMRTLCTKQLDFLDYLGDKNVLEMDLKEAKSAAVSEAPVAETAEPDDDTKLFRPVDIKGFNLSDLK